MIKISIMCDYGCTCVVDIAVVSPHLFAASASINFHSSSILLFSHYLRPNCLGIAVCFDHSCLYPYCICATPTYGLVCHRNPRRPQQISTISVHMAEWVSFDMAEWSNPSLSDTAEWINVTNLTNIDINTGCIWTRRLNLLITVCPIRTYIAQRMTCVVWLSTMGTQRSCWQKSLYPSQQSS